MNGSVTPPLGMAFQLWQYHQAKFRQLSSQQPAILYIQQGTKRVEIDNYQEEIPAGQWLLLPEDRVFTVENIPPADAPYLAVGLAVERSLFEAAYQNLSPQAGSRSHQVQSLACAGSEELLDSFMRFRELLKAPGDRPASVLRLHLQQLIVWLAELGAVLPQARAKSLGDQIRETIVEDLPHEWRAGTLARLLRVSEATLRRKLAAEGTSFSQILSEQRLISALGLLQSSEDSIAQVALAVGYDSPSRFATRFRERFGVNPSHIRA